MGEDFYGEGADAKISDLGQVTLADIFAPLVAGKNVLLEGKRDEPHSHKKEEVVEVTSVHSVSAVTEKPKVTGWTPHFLLGH